MTIDDFDHIVEHERDVRRHDRFTLAAFAAGVLVILLAMLAI